MSLKSKIEQAVLDTIAAAESYAGNLYSSQEDNATTRELPCVVAIWSDQRHQPLGPKGQTIGLVRGRLDVLVMGTADQSDADSTPAVSFAAQVRAVRDILYDDDLPGVLTTHATDLTVLGGFPVSPPGYESEGRVFQEVLSWELSCGEFAC